MMREKKQTRKRKEHKSRDGRTVKKEKKKRDKEPAEGEWHKAKKGAGHYVVRWQR